MSITVISTTEPKGAAIASGNLAAKESSVETKQSASVEKQDEIKEASDTSAALDNNEETAEPQDENETNEESDVVDEEKKPKKSGGFKKKIDKLVKSNSELMKSAADKDREIEVLRKLALEGKKPAEAPAPVVKETLSNGEPDPEKFDSHAEYVKAVSKWAIKQDKEEQEIKAKEEKVKSEYQKSVESFHAKLTKFQESHDDFDDVIESASDILAPPALQGMIMESDLTAELMYELSSNREEYAKLCELARTNPRAADREIYKIEARLSKPSESSHENKPEIKTTKAPAPIKPVGSSGSAKTSKRLDDPNLSQAEYERIRREQIAKNKA